MSTQALAPVPAQQMVAGTDFTREELDLIKSTVAPKLTDPEFKLFLYMARARGLNPIKKQIYAIKRWDSEQGREVMTIQTSIDGFRVIGERTGCYSPGREPTYREREDGTLISATAYVMKRTADGTWHEVAATAYWDEYKQTKKGGDLTSFWRRMPHGQLAKCAEALAIRKAFPDDTAGIYTFDEMAQADNGQDERPPQPVVQMPRRLSERSGTPSAAAVVEAQVDEPGSPPPPVDPEDDGMLALLEQSVAEVNARAEAKGDEPISQKQLERLFAIARENGHEDDAVKKWLKDSMGFASRKAITTSKYDAICRRLEDPQPLEV